MKLKTLLLVSLLVGSDAFVPCRRRLQRPGIVLQPTWKRGTLHAAEGKDNGTNVKTKNKQRRQVYKHVFRYYSDISFDSWLRCMDPEDFLFSVGYTRDEIKALSDDLPSLLELDVHDQLAPKVRFIVEAMGGGTGRLIWKSENDGLDLKLDKEEECSTMDETDPVEIHSMRLDEAIKKRIPASFFAKTVQLDRVVAPSHAYLVHSKIVNGISLLKHSSAWEEFLQCVTTRDMKSNRLAFCEFCNKWDIESDGIKENHTVEDIQAFESIVTPGLLPISKASEQSRRLHQLHSSSNLVAIMLQHGANPLEYDSQGISPLHWIAGKGDWESFQILLKALTEESQQSIIDCIEEKREPKEGATPFHWACGHICSSYPSETSFQYLLQEAGEDRGSLASQATWTHNQTPLMWAAWAGNLAIVDMLVLHGANPLHRDINGQTAMHWSAASGNLDVCQYLFDYSVHVGGRHSLNDLDEKGKTPQDYAREYRQHEVVSWMVKQQDAAGDILDTSSNETKARASQEGMS